MIHVQEALKQLPERFNKRLRLIEHAKRLNTRLLLVCGDEDYRITISNGAVSQVERGPFVMGEWDFTLQADEQIWQTFWQPLPPPGFHDLLALSKARKLSIQGNLYPFMSNLLYFKELFATPRQREAQ